MAEDYYENKSEISLPLRNQLWNKLAGMIQVQAADELWKKNQYALHQTMLLVLSSTYFNENILVVGDDFTTNCVKQYAQILRQDNQVKMLGITELQHDGAEAFLRDNKELFTIVVLPYQMVANSMFLKHLEQNTLQGSTLVLYNVPETLIQVTAYGQAESHYWKEQSKLADQLCDLIRDYDCLMKDNDQKQKNSSWNTPSDKEDEHHENLECLINKVQQAEDYVNQNYQQIRIIKIQDDLNELKNSLLDYLYGKEPAYFYERVNEKVEIIKQYLV